MLHSHLMKLIQKALLHPVNDSKGGLRKKTEAVRVSNCKAPWGLSLNWTFPPKEYPKHY